MATIYLNDRKRIVEHPRLGSKLMVRYDNPQQCWVMWDRGHKIFSIAELPTSWQRLENELGQQLPVRVKRTGMAGRSHGVNNLAVEFD